VFKMISDFAQRLRVGIHEVLKRWV